MPLRSTRDSPQPALSLLPNYNELAGCGIYPICSSSAERVDDTTITGFNFLR